MLFFTFDDNEKRKTRETKDETAGKHYAEILAYCRYHLNFDKSAAEECAQDVFTAFFEHTAYSEIQNPRAWLYRTADNYINRYKRDLAKQKSMILTFPDEEEDDNITKDDKFVFNQDLDYFFDNTINVEIYTEKILACLDKEEFELYRLHFKEHLSFQEIANINALTYKAVSNRLYRIEMKIKREIAKLNFGVDAPPIHH